MQGVSRKRARRADERRGEVRTSVPVTALETLLLLPCDQAHFREQADALLAYCVSVTPLPVLCLELAS